MKITMNIECTPDEARAMMGLPDVQPIQEAMMAELQQQFVGAIRAANPMLASWQPPSAPVGMNTMMDWHKMWLHQWQQGMSQLSTLAKTGTER